MIDETLTFEGYVLEDHDDRIPEKKGVYCAYACSLDEKNEWVGTDVVYFGKAEEGDSTIRARVIAHKADDDGARRTLGDGEKLIYSYAETDNPDACEKALVEAHSALPRLANDRLTHGYKGPEIKLQIKGKAAMLHKSIYFPANEDE